MDYNKLIKDIIRAAKEDPAIVTNAESSFTNAKLTTTLKVEVKVSKSFPETDGEEPINATKFVLLRIND